MHTLHTRHTRPRGARPLAVLLALLTAVAGLVSVAAPAQAVADEGVFLSRFGAPGSGDGQFAQPGDIDTDADGNVYVVDTFNARINTFDASGAFVRAIRVAAGGSAIHGVAVDQEGHVFSTGRMDVGGGRVTDAVAKFSSDGELLATFPLTSGYYPYGVDVDSQGNIYALTWEGRVTVLNPAGQVMRTWIAPGNRNGFVGVAVDEDGFVYVVNRYLNYVRKFTTTGEFVQDFSQIGDQPISSPLGVAVNAAGQVAVTEYNGPGVTVFSAAGDIESTVGTGSGTGDGQFLGPSGVHLGDDGIVHVVDDRRNDVQKFQVWPAFASFKPRLDGSGRALEELTVSASTTPDPTSWSRAWTVSGSDEVRSTSTTFTPRLTDVGKTVTVAVTAKGADGTPRDRTVTATKIVTGAQMDTTAVIIDSTPETPPTTGDVLSVEVDESTLPDGVTGAVRWGRMVADRCVTAGEPGDEYTVADGDAGATICAELTYGATGYDALTKVASTGTTAVGTFTAPSPTIDVEAPVVSEEVTATVDLSDAPAGAEVESWQWGVVAGADCTAMDGADSRTFTPQRSDFEKSLCVTVTVSAPHHLDATTTATFDAVQAGAFPGAPTATIIDPTPDTAPTTGDVLSVEVDESTLPADGAVASVRWGRVAGGDCVMSGDPADEYTVVDGDAAATICAEVTYEAHGYVALTKVARSTRTAVGTFAAPSPTVDVEFPVVGETLTSSVDLANAPEGAEVTGWQWGLVDGEACTAIDGADSRTFTPEVADFEKRLCVTVTVSAPHHLDARATVTLAEVGEGVFGQAPTVSIVGTPQVGVAAAVAVTDGDPTEAERDYQWNLGTDPIAGATGETYTPKPGDEGDELSVTVTSSSKGYVDDVTTSVAVTVAHGAFGVPTPQFSSQHPVVGTPVSLPLDLSNAPEGATGQWQWGVVEGQECVAVDGATDHVFTPTADEVGDVLCVGTSVSAEGYASIDATYEVENTVVRGTLPAMRAVLNTTSPRVGAKLTAALFSGPLPAGAKTTVSWGYSPAGAACRPTTESSSLAIKSTMVGRLVCALVTVSAPGYVEQSMILKTGPVKETALMTVTPKKIKGTQKFTVRAQGLQPYQRYRIVKAGKNFRGKADSYGRVVRTITYGKGLRSKTRLIAVRGYAHGTVTYAKRVKVTYRAR